MLAISYRRSAKAALAAKAALEVSLAEARAELARRPRSVECDDMLRDLLSGGSLLHVKRVNPDDVFMQSPRGR